MPTENLLPGVPVRNPRSTPRWLQKAQAETQAKIEANKARVWIPLPFAACGLPVERQAVSTWRRRNGGDVLVLSRKGGPLPSGRLPFAILVGLSDAVRAGRRQTAPGGWHRVALGRTWAEAMRTCGLLQPGQVPSGGKNGRLTAFREQAEALFGADTFFLRLAHGTDKEEEQAFEWTVVELTDWADDRKGPPPDLPPRSMRFGWRLDATDGVAVEMDEITFELFADLSGGGCIGLDQRVLDALPTHQALAFQVYAWLACRSARGSLGLVPIPALVAQFGSEAKTIPNAARKLQAALEAVKRAWPEAPFVVWQKGKQGKTHASLIMNA